MKALSTLILVLSVIASSEAQSSKPSDPEQVDIEGFMSYFSEDILVRNFDTGVTTANHL